MTGVARRWRGRFWAVKFDNGLNLYPITTDELRSAMKVHDITVHSDHPADQELVG